MKVLLVDDEPMVLELLKERVSKVIVDGELYDFTSAKKAMEYAKNCPVDVAFLDINMRIIDGVAMAKQLQALYPSINIIFCTGYTEYMQDALDMYCSAYLIKPITEEKIQKAMENLRHPVVEKIKVRFQCFGNFEAFYNDAPIVFRYSKTKELLAYLVDRNGVDCTTAELMAVLFGDSVKRSYFNHVRADLLSTFTGLGVEEVLRLSKGKLGINRDKVKCDHFDFQDGRIGTPPREYMSQFSFGELTYPRL